MASPDPTLDAVKRLCDTVEAQFPSERLGNEQWQILMISALTTGGLTKHAATFYQHLIARPEYETSAARQALVRRLREALFKLSSVVGVPKPIEAIFAIAKVEQEEDKDFTCTRKDWTLGPESRERGLEWLGRLYKANHGPIQNTFSSHPDFDWQATEITYGLYLSDHSILGPEETELVVLTGIMMQNLNMATGWHLRGMRRIGMTAEDLDKIQQCIRLVAEMCEIKLDKVPTVADIEHEV